MVSSTDSVVCEIHTSRSGSRTTTCVDRGRRVDHLDVLGGLALRALDLLVPVVADEQDVVVLGREPHGLLVHLGHQGARRVDRLQRPRAAPTRAPPGETPCAENTTRAPSGTSSVSLTNTAPRAASVSTTNLLWTISLRTYTGAP